jgi:TolB-like protein
MSGDKEQDFFGDGISEDIITALSKLRWLFVIARNSTFAYKGKSPDVRQVARELGVHYVLEGSVRRAGERLRISAQLIDAKSGAHVWAERYDRAAVDIFEVQDEITESVVGSLEPRLYAAENLRLQKRPTESLDAWGCVMRAMPYIGTWTARENEAGIKLLTRALELDPEYGRATSLLGWLYAARAHLGLADPSAELEKALSLGQRAMDQDYADPWAHLVVGYVHMVARRPNAAREALSEALDRNPNFAFAHMALGSSYGYAGKGDEGMRHVALSMRLSPRDSIQAATCRRWAPAISPPAVSPRPSSSSIALCGSGRVSALPGAALPRWPVCRVTMHSPPPRSPRPCGSSRISRSTGPSAIIRSPTGSSAPSTSKVCAAPD